MLIDSNIIIYGAKPGEVIIMSKKPSESEQANSNPKHQAMRAAGSDDMKECLKVAEQIRLGLSGRMHSDSTELAAEDRQR